MSHPPLGRYTALDRIHPDADLVKDGFDDGGSAVASDGLKAHEALQLVEEDRQDSEMDCR